jgi:hypothetical protein
MSVEASIQKLAGELFDSSDLAAMAHTPTTLARSAAFVVLVHAEIEFAIEQECKVVAELLEKAAEPGTAMLAWGFISVREDGSKKHGKEPLAALASIYQGVLDHNNGIKREHLEAMLGPIGVSLAKHNLEVTTLDGFGKYRGALAHAPLSKWTTPDLPSAVRNKGITAGKATDAIINSIKKSHSTIRSAPPRRGLRLRKRFAAWLRRLASSVE